MERVKVCPKCSAGMYWDVEDGAWICSNCDKIIETDEDDYDVIEDDEVPMGCSTCGGFDNYPNCYDSCPMNPDN